MVVHVAVAVAVQADVLDLVGLVVVGRVDVAAVQADALLPALADAEDVMGVEEHALENVAPHVLEIVVEAVQADAEDVLDVRDVEAHVQAHARLVEKVRLVVHAIAALAVLVHVLRVLRVADAVDVMDVVGVAAVRPVATAVVDVQEDAMVAVVADALVDAVDVQEAVVGAQDVVLDAMAHVLAHATDVVMDAVVHVRMHAQQLARQHALEHAKLKHSAL